MTRTQKLNLFTWALNDPVDLDQMNENFGLLDISAARTEAALWNSAMGLLAAAHAGQNVSLSESAFVDALASPAQTQSYSNLKFGEDGAQVLTQGYSGTNGQLDHLDIPRGTEITVHSFTPNGYGSLTKFTISGAQSYADGQTVRMRVYAGTAMVAENSQVLHPGEQGFSQEFTFTCQLDPNKQYTIKATQTGNRTNATIQINSWTLTVSPQVHASGHFLSDPISVPAGATRMRLLCRATGTAHTVSVKEGSGSFHSLTLTRSTDNGTTLSTAQTAITAGTQTVQLKFELTAAGAAIKDYAVIFI